MKTKFVILNLALITLIAVLVLNERDAKQSEEIAAMQKQVGQREIDPRVQRYIERNKRCPNANQSFGWICGNIVSFPGAHFSEVCTSPEMPFFSGSLSLPDQPSFLGHSFGQKFQLPLDPLVPCDVGWPEETHECAGIGLSPAEELSFGYFGEVPPNPLANDFLPPPYGSKHTLAPDAFAELDGLPVALFYTEWIGKKPGAAPDQCTLQVKRMEWRMSISPSLPCAEMDDWKMHLRNAISIVEEGTVSRGSVASCNVPPEEVVLLINKFSSRAMDQFPKWLDLHGY